MEMTVAEVRKLLQGADAVEFEALERSLAADTRKGVRAALETCRRRIEVEEAERLRIQGLYDFDARHAEANGGGLVVGLDEVGRGAVAGPLAVGAVVLPREPHIEGLNDSKRLTPQQREVVAADVKARALCWQVFYVDPHDIDTLGMSACLRKAFSGALSAIDKHQDGISTVLIDGNPLGIDSREVSAVKGDAQSASIAAASIVAKVERDALMGELSTSYPQYGFDKNKGYGSADHIEAIRIHGVSEVHRSSFCTSFLQETLF